MEWTRNKIIAVAFIAVILFLGVTTIITILATRKPPVPPRTSGGVLNPILPQTGRASSVVGEDNRAIRGTWQMISGIQSGQPTTNPAQTQVILSLDTMVVVADGKAYSAKYTLDPARQPKQIDLTPVPQNRDPGAQVPVIEGIYELAGDVLRICYALPGGPRPAVFASEANSPNALMILQRTTPAIRPRPATAPTSGPQS